MNKEFRELEIGEKFFPLNKNGEIRDLRMVLMKISLIGYDEEANLVATKTFRISNIAIRKKKINAVVVDSPDEKRGQYDFFFEDTIVCLHPELAH